MSVSQDNPVITGNETTADILMQEDTPAEKPEELQEPPKEEETPVEEEPEEELAEPDEEEQPLEEEPLKDEIEELTIAPARKKEILAKYPELFKEFPILEHSWYRARAYTEIFPTPKDAQAAAERIGSFEQFENELINGSNESVLKALKDNAPESFGRVVDNYLKNLQKVDQGAYHHVLGNYAIKPIIVAMGQEALRHQQGGNEEVAKQIRDAALIMHQFVFGTSQFEPIQQFGPKEQDNAQAKQLEQERRQFASERFNTVQNDLFRAVSNSVRSLVEANIDPRGSMSAYVKSKAVEDAMSAVQNTIANDREYRSVNDRLWDTAFRTNYSDESKQRLKSAYVTRARLHLPGIIRKVRESAIRGLAPKRPERDRQGPLPQGKSSTHSNRGGSTKEQAAKIPRGMSTLQFLSEDK
jgi:hypothetical protein